MWVERFNFKELRWVGCDRFERNWSKFFYEIEKSSTCRAGARVSSAAAGSGFRSLLKLWFIAKKAKWLGRGLNSGFLLAKHFLRFASLAFSRLKIETFLFFPRLFFFLSLEPLWTKVTHRNFWVKLKWLTPWRKYELHGALLYFSAC